MVQLMLAMERAWAAYITAFEEAFAVQVRFLNRVVSWIFVGHAPPPGRLPTRIEFARNRYARDEITIEQFEAIVERLLADGTADQQCPPRPPPNPADVPMFRAPMMERR